MNLPAFTAAAAILAAGTAVAQDRTSYLTDEKGRAVYLLEADEKNTSRCYDACAEVWPPVPASARSLRAKEGKVHKELVGTLERRGGERQLTYNGHPLYYYAKDRGAGRATGQDVHDKWGEWYLVRADGTKLEAHAQGVSAGGSGGQSAEPERTFLTLDENRDGNVTRNEAGGMPSLAQSFSRADADNDGSISRYEFNTFISR